MLALSRVPARGIAATHRAARRTASDRTRLTSRREGTSSSRRRLRATVRACLCLPSATFLVSARVSCKAVLCTVRSSCVLLFLSSPCPVPSTPRLSLPSSSFPPSAALRPPSSIVFLSFPPSFCRFSRSLSRSVAPSLSLPHFSFSPSSLLRRPSHRSRRPCRMHDEAATVVVAVICSRILLVIVAVVGSFVAPDRAVRLR